MKKRAHFEIYRDVSEKYRWRFRAVNGKIIADSGESYESIQGAQTAAALVVRLMSFQDQPIIEHV